MDRDELVAFLRDDVLPYLHFAKDANTSSLGSGDHYLLVSETLRLHDETLLVLQKCGITYADERKTDRRIIWDHLRVALQWFLDSIPNDDMPKVLHGIIGFEDKDTQEMLRFYPVRMVRNTDNPADNTR